LREGGLQAIAGISKAGSFDDLDKLYRNGPDAIRNRKDMQPSDIADLDKAEQSHNFQQMQNAMVRTLAGKGQADDAATTQRSIDTNIENIKSQIGERLVPYSQKAMEGILWMANKIGAGITDPNSEGGSVFVGPLKSGMNGSNSRVDPRYAMADSLSDKTNYLFGQTEGIAWKYNGAVNDGMKQLSGMGVDPAHAAAIMANAAAESSMDPNARNGNMYGLFQFDKSRQADFQKVMGKSIIGSSRADQIAYMVKSMQKGGEEAGPGQDFWNASGGDLAGYFTRKIERTDHPGKNGMIRDGIANEIQGDTTITVNVHPTLSGTKTKTLSAKVSKPSSAGSRNQNIQISG